VRLVRESKIIGLVLKWLFKVLLIMRDIIIGFIIFKKAEKVFADIV
jgi:hypothetical protein